MNIYANFAQAADVTRLRVAVREMENAPRYSEAWTVANAKYQLAWNNLYHSGMSASEIYTIAASACKDQLNGGNSNGNR